jgi:asparagine synthase (glutamine-hydrolysing)
MADALVHRGPDDGGTWSDAERGVALGHRRLSIIDLSPAGHQPMASRSGRYRLVYNGEIYNHAAIRRELDGGAAVEWRGHSDTETFLEGVERWGLEAALSRSVGMFALALWDRETQTLSLARDRMGEKPLYYGWTRQGFVFASELKAIRAAPGFDARIDPGVLALYLQRNCVPAPWSIFRDVYKLEPGAILTIGRAAVAGAPEAPLALPSTAPGLNYRCYWSLDAVVSQPIDASLTADDAVAQLEALLVGAVKEQAVADVPVGAFLSGGVDSSAIVALMKRSTGADVKTFTIGFDDPGFDEAPFARAVAHHLGTDHTEMYVSPADVLGIIPQLPAIYDEPFADSSQLPTYLVSRLARSRVTVALSGDAGDELFGGYNRYRVSRQAWERVGRLPEPARHLLASGISAVSPAGWDRLGRMPGLGLSMLGNKAHKFARMLRGDLSVRDIYEASSQEWQGSSPVRHAPAHLPSRAEPVALAGSAEAQMMYWDTRGYLADDILVKVDRAAMANSLETRAPFLDHRIVEFAWRLPLSLKIQGGQGKWLLRQLLYRHVPRTLIERPKAGFAIPIGSWLRGPLRDWAEDLLSEPALAREPAFDPAVIRARWSQHLRGTHDWTGAIWSVLMYQAWAAE